MDEKLFTEFTKWIKDQFIYGGKKYAHDNQRESTDILFDKHGKNWLIGTIDKYTFRFKNLARQKDLLKIATYMYIFWLKRGFHIMLRGINSPAIDTNVKIKTEQFDLFIERVKNGKNCLVNYEQNKEKSGFTRALQDDDQLLKEISYMLGKFSLVVWQDITENALIEIFLMSFILWSRKVKAGAFKLGDDVDTWNSKEKK